MEISANLVQHIVPHAQMKILAQAVFQNSLFHQSISLQLSLIQCVNKFAVMEKGLSMLVMTETQKTMTVVMISVK